MRKRILITGSTDGIGKLLAIRLAGEGHQVFVHGRDPKKLAETVSMIKGTTKNVSIKGFVADFSNLNDVREMAKQIKKELDCLDMLINNAGIFKSPIPKNRDGLDIRFVVNYLAPWLLTDQLMPLMKKGTDPRIINLSSAAQSSVSDEALRGKKEISVNEAYAQSKLALTMWSFRVAEEQKGMVVIPVNPGSLLNTKMANEAYGQHWSPADKGVDILYDLAFSDEHKGMTGKYFDNDNRAYAKAHPDAYDEKEIDKLITTTTQLINL